MTPTNEQDEELVERVECETATSPNDPVIFYIGDCQYDDCDEPACRWIAAQIIRTEPVNRGKRIWEEQGYFCKEHAENARESEWEIVEDYPANPDRCPSLQHDD